MLIRMLYAIIVTLQINQIMTHINYPICWSLKENICMYSRQVMHKLYLWEVIMDFIK